MDGFVTVLSKRRRSKSTKKTPRRHVCQQEEELNLSLVVRTRDKLTKSFELIQSIGLTRHLLSLLSKHASINPGNLFHFTQCISYGIGSFTSSNDSLMQLAFLLSLKKLLTQVEKWVVYDPIFSVTEKVILSEYDLKILDYNDFGHHCVEKPTLFYMPHCPLPLYHNLLWSNWPSLNQIFLLGNSFNAIDQVLIGKDDRIEYYLIDHIIRNSSFTEFEICPSTDKLTAFHDLSLHFFIIDKNDPSYAEVRSKLPPIYSGNALSEELL